MTRLAIVGCGRVAEVFHLPALARTNDLVPAVLVDADADRARYLGERFGVPRVQSSLEAAASECDAALVAVPNRLHADVSVFFLDRGRHVLVEKPMATTVREAERVADAATKNGVTLSVAMVRRFTATHQVVRQIVEARTLGAVESVLVRDGVIYSWSAVSPFFLSRQEAGGGVLVDFGPHVLDALLWWFGDLALQSYEDDSRGGVEAECRAQFLAPGGVPITVELSRLHNLACTARLVCGRGTVEANLRNADLDVTISGTPFVIRGQAGIGAGPSWSPGADPFVLQLEAFARDVERNVGLAPTVAAAQRIAGIVEACYAGREPLHGPASPSFPSECWGVG